MNKIKTLIIDDELFARDGVKLLLENEDEIELLGEAKNGDEAVKLIKNLNPDLIFLDIQMPGKNGFEVLDELFPGEIPIVVFITAYDQFAIKAFEANAIDYLLKPFDDDRFYKTLEKAKQYFKMKSDLELNEKMINLMDDITSLNLGRKNESKDFPKRISIKSGGEIKLLDVNEIDFIEAADYCSILHSRSGKFTIRESMKNLEEKLDPDYFIRIHRSTIVNINQITPWSTNFYNHIYSTNLPLVAIN